jgi:hypothetical protein
MSQWQQENPQARLTDIEAVAEVEIAQVMKHTAGI